MFPAEQLAILLAKLAYFDQKKVYLHIVPDRLAKEADFLRRIVTCGICKEFLSSPIW